MWLVNAKSLPCEIIGCTSRECFRPKGHSKAWVFGTILLWVCAEDRLRRLLSILVTCFTHGIAGQVHHCQL